MQNERFRMLFDDAKMDTISIPLSRNIERNLPSCHNPNMTFVTTEHPCTGLYCKHSKRTTDTSSDTLNSSSENSCSFKRFTHTTEMAWFALPMPSFFLCFPTPSDIYFK